MTIALLFAGLYDDLFCQAVVLEGPDGVVTITSAVGRYWAWVFAFVVMAPFCFWCWRQKIGGNLAPGFFFASFAIPAIILPGIAAEKIVIGPQQLTTQTGFWFSPTVDEFSLANLRQVTEVVHKVPERFGLTRTDILWEFHYPNGMRESLKHSDLFGANRETIADALRKRKIEVQLAEEI
jgi:hypothetical protein